MSVTGALLNPTGFVSSSGYLAIFVLSVLQSCCVPTSSELTLGFGGVLASEGTLSLPGVIAAGTAGEIVGAYLAWAAGRAGGRPLVERYGRFVLLSPHDLDRASAWYGRHERWGVLGSRLLPVIRNFVAVPAGVARVPAVRFGVLTAVGSLVWDGAMALIGYGIGSQWRSVMKGFSDAGYLLAALAVIAVAVVTWHRWRSYRAYASGTGEPSSRPGARPRPHGAALSEARPASGALRPPPAGALKVPAQITAVFWAIKLLSTAMGESVSDALVHGINQYLAVMVGFLLFAVAMWLQLRARRYNPWTYWFAVAMVAVFGTMAADVLHIGLHVPYLASSAFYLVALVLVFAVWHRVEGTLSIHSIFTTRREVFYWMTVLTTFALGTAVGDLTAISFKVGYLSSGVLFAVVFVLPGVAYGIRWAGPVAAFWLSYILTRPLGASFADWLGFSPHDGGLGFGHPLAALVFALPILALVSWVASTGIDNGPLVGMETAGAARTAPAD
ncbi:MAG: VTT domain-containing protein [Acidimicrobiales bacterium]